jgi:hypothetical protein
MGADGVAGAALGTLRIRMGARGATSRALGTLDDCLARDFGDEWGSLVCGGYGHTIQMWRILPLATR